MTSKEREYPIIGIKKRPKPTTILDEHFNAFYHKTGEYVMTKPMVAEAMKDFANQYHEYECNRLALRPPKRECGGNCGMNYCDENGCIDRKRNIVDTPKVLSNE
jgi:hypothetical protein